MKVEFIPLDPSSWVWTYRYIKPVLTKDTKGIVARRIDTGEFLASTVFDSWLPNSAHIHVVIKNPLVLRHGYIEEVMNYFFNTADRELLIGVTPSNNVQALKFNRHVGFQETYRVVDGYMFGVDLVIQELRKDNCRWIEHGKARRASSA